MFNFCMHFIIPFWKFRPSYRARAALPGRTSACWVCSCFRNSQNCDMDYRIFNSVRDHAYSCVYTRGLGTPTTSLHKWHYAFLHVLERNSRRSMPKNGAMTFCMSQSETQEGACRMMRLCLSVCLSQSETQQGACRMMRLCLFLCPKAKRNKQHAY